jgi:hypothetical protein
MFMTKRSAKRFLREGHLDESAFSTDSKVRRLNVHVGGGGGGNWSPMGNANDERDQGYLKTIKPKSEGQAALLSAIDEKNLILALGPAGTARPIWLSPRPSRRWKAARSAVSSCRVRPLKPANRSAFCPATWKTSWRHTCVLSTMPSPTVSA